jgi:hypothetical protein
MSNCFWFPLGSGSRTQTYSVPTEPTAHESCGCSAWEDFVRFRTRKCVLLRTLTILKTYSSSAEIKLLFRMGQHGLTQEIPRF